MPLSIRVFTHPACSGCGTAVRMAWELQNKYPQLFELRTVKLENKEGLDEAHAEHVRTIPTIILSKGDQELERIVGTPKPEQMENFIKHKKEI